MENKFEASWTIQCRSRWFLDLICYQKVFVRRPKDVIGANIKPPSTLDVWYTSSKRTVINTANPLPVETQKQFQSWHWMCFVNPNNSTRTILTQTGVLAGIWQYSKEGDIMAVRSLWWTSFFLKTLSPCRQEYILCPNSSVSTLNKSIENNVNPCIWILEEEFLSLSGSSCVQIMGISK